MLGIIFDYSIYSLGNIVINDNSKQETESAEDCIYEVIYNIKVDYKSKPNHIKFITIKKLLIYNNIISFIIVNLLF